MSVFPSWLRGRRNRSLTNRLPNLLDDPDLAGSPISFYERTYRMTPEIARELGAIRVSKRSAAIDLDARMFRVVRELLVGRMHLEQEIARIPAAKKSTREELYRRLHIAHEYIESCFRRQLMLTEMAQVACLSPNHLLRCYRSLFGQTPHQTLTSCRLEAAASLLVESDTPVTQICYEVGFSSLGSFSSLFKRAFGSSPRDFRTQK